MAKKRPAIYIDEEETPLFYAWTERNPRMWPKLIKSLMEDLLQRGVIPMDMLAVKVDQGMRLSESVAGAESDLSFPSGDTPRSADARVDGTAATTVSGAPATAMEDPAAQVTTSSLPPASTLPTAPAPAPPAPSQAGFSDSQAEQSESAQIDSGRGRSGGDSGVDVEAARNAALRALMQNQF